MLVAGKLPVVGFVPAVDGFAALYLGKRKGQSHWRSGSKLLADKGGFRSTNFGGDGG
jgi:hypothetical protein